jgi:glyoxylase-like metal-dependent hydrolase (beta-lactamase superfamily II)
MAASARSGILPDIPFDRHFEPAHGTAVQVAPNVRRVTAANAGPFTLHGTNSYIVGSGTVAVIDPGPDDPAHLAALLAATRGETISHVVLTHTHRDHSDGVRALVAATGAVTAGQPHRVARPLHSGEVNLLDAASDTAFRPDVLLADDARIEGEGWALTAVATPGHTANHLAFALDGTDLLFSGDHVMAWSTSIVAPPDGSMADYMASLGRLLDRPENRYLPGHGGPVVAARDFVRSLIAHRKMRETAILHRLAAGDRTIPVIVAALYRDTPAALHAAAGLSVLAHLEDLVARGLVAAEGAPRPDATFRPATAAR